jgi:Putative bacterial sensory transduction regulator
VTRFRFSGAGYDLAMPDPAAEKLPALSNDMIAAALDARAFAYSTDADGDIYGNWENNLIYFFRIGEAREMLQVRTMARRLFSTDEVPRLYAFCNGWNHDRLFPKAYVHVDENRDVRVVGEVVADWEHGVTAEQLDQVMICGIATGCQLAAEVEQLAI